MKYVQKLATLIRDRWRLRHYDSDAFAEIASQSLAELPGSSHVDHRQILEWAVTTDPLPPQDRPGSTFGEPAIRLFDDGRFYIQALFWFDGTTSIHQHSFSGAFEVLAGSSIHARYGFAPTRRYSEHLKLGKLALTNVELLERGQVRPIVRGDRFIHALFHLDHPSVTLLVRTHKDAESGPLYTYLEPGIAFDSFHVTPRIQLARQALAAAEKIGGEALERLAHAALGHADAEEALHILLACQQLTPAPGWPERLARLERSTRSKDERWARTLRRALHEEQRIRWLVDCRRHVRKPELRFLLALLLMVPTGARILTLVRDRFPRRDPVKQVVDWVGQLWDIEIATEDEARVSLLQLECDDGVKAPALAILGAMLRSKSDKEIVRSMSRYRGVGRICKLWREQPLLMPLFR